MAIRNHTERRSWLAEAVWRLVLREGVAGASVRAVAREADLSMGSVRYFFTTQDELLRFAMREVVERARARIEAGARERAAKARAGKPVEAAVELLEQVVPLDDERLAEARIHLSFTVRGTTDPEMVHIRREADQAVRGLCRDTLNGLAELGHVAADRDPDVETERLWALLDGLTMHLMLDPDSTSPERAREVLRSHVKSLSTSGAAS